VASLCTPREPCEGGTYRGVCGGEARRRLCERASGVTPANGAGIVGGDSSRERPPGHPLVPTFSRSARQLRHGHQASLLASAVSGYFFLSLFRAGRGWKESLSRLGGESLGQQEDAPKEDLEALPRAWTLRTLSPSHDRQPSQLARRGRYAQRQAVAELTRTNPTPDAAVRRTCPRSILRLEYPGSSGDAFICEPLRIDPGSRPRDSCDGAWNCRTNRCSRRYRRSPRFEFCRSAS
jgi:hypothetical protein